MNGRPVEARKAGLTKWLRLTLRNQWIEADARGRAEKQAAEDRETENNIIALIMLFAAFLHNGQHQHINYSPV